MDLYGKYCLPFLIDWAMANKQLIPLRKEILSEASGTVLEIGFGSGANLPYYPLQVQRLIALENHEGLLHRSKKRRHFFKGDFQAFPCAAEKIGLEAASVDCVVITFTLCSLNDVSKALRETRRVLKKGGKIIFLEHGLSPDRAVQKWQRRLTPIQRRLAGGCRLDRNIAGLFADACIDVDEKRSFYLDRVPKAYGYMTLGKARM